MQVQEWNQLLVFLFKKQFGVYGVLYACQIIPKW